MATLNKSGLTGGQSKGNIKSKMFTAKSAMVMQLE